jgi:hypothetical protein
MFAPDELIAALADAGVDYVLIGGLAVGAHGFPRATKDIDIVPAPDGSNLERLAAVLRTVDARHHGLGDLTRRSSLSIRLIRRSSPRAATSC